MTLRFIDSFDVYAPQNIIGIAHLILPMKYATIVSINQNQFTTGRNGGGALTFGGTLLQTRNFSSQTTWIVGFAFRNNSYTGAAIPLLRFFDGTNEQVRLEFNGTTGFISAARSTTTLGVGTKSLVTGTWYYVEAKVVINTSSGSVITNINTIQDLNLTSQNTQTNGNASTNSIGLAGASSDTSNWSFDDLYICDSVGSVNNNFLGDMKVEAVLPDTIGSNTTWTPVNGADNFVNVNTSNPIASTAYVYTSTVNNIDTYKFLPLTKVASNIAGVMVNILTKRTDSTAHNLATVVKTATTNAGTSQAIPDTASNYLTQVYETDPNDNVTVFTPSIVNSAEFGMKLIS